MYPAFDWSVVLRAHHGYQRACVLITGQASTDHLGHQVSRAPGRPNLHLLFILSQTSAGKRGLCHRSLPISASSCVRAVKPFLRPGLHIVRGIARIVGVREAEVANRLLAARSLMPRRPPSLTSTVCGDPLPGRSALDRPRDQRTIEEGPL